MDVKQQSVADGAVRAEAPLAEEDSPIGPKWPTAGATWGPRASEHARVFLPTHFGIAKDDLSVSSKDSMDGKSGFARQLLRDFTALG